MKKRILSMVLTMSLAFSMIATSALAADGHVHDETCGYNDGKCVYELYETGEDQDLTEAEADDGEIEISTEEITGSQENPDTEIPEETEEVTEEPSSEEDAVMSLESEETTPLLGSSFSVAETEMETETETDEESETLCDHGNDAENCPVCDLEEQIAVLPALDEVQAMTGDEEEAVYAQASALADVYYDDLTAEEQAQVSNIDTLWGILDYFSDSLTLALSASSCTHSYTNGICTVCDAYQPATLNGSTYEISNAGQLFWFASLVNGDATQEGITAAVPDADAVLTDDIDLESREWTPIGNYNMRDWTGSLYCGTFDGQNYIVSGLYINNEGDGPVQGLFGYVNGGTVQNVTVSGSVTGYNYTGIVVGYIGSGGTITNCSSSGKVSGNNYVGGVVGYTNSSVTVEYCINSGEVSGNNDVGGVVGLNHGTVKYCINSGTVSGSSRVAGVVGNNDGTVTSCGNSASVSGSGNVGGVVGYNGKTLNDSYNIGTVNSTGDTAGGVVGYNYASGWTTGTVENCYYLSTTASAAYSTNSGTIGDDVLSKTATEFASGEVAYLLNGSVSGGATWYQNLDNGKTVDSYPVLDNTHGTVYYGTNCQNTTGYSNTNLSATNGHSYEAVVTEPTCTAGGYTTYTCSVCGDSYVADETEATGHNYEAVATEATYMAQGYTTYTCTHCGDSYEADYTAVKVIDGTDGNLSTKTTVQELIAVPGGLKKLYASVDALVSDLIKRVVAVGTGYTEDNALVYDVVLQYSTDGGKTWITATVDNFPADGITVTLPYPDGTDASYEFTVLHMFTVYSDRLGITAGDTESPTVTKTDDGLVFTLTGLSPVAVSWKAVTTSTTETDTSSQADTTTVSTDTSGTSASSTTSAQTGDNSQMVLWLVLLLLSGVGVTGIAAYYTKRRRSR